MDKNCFKTVWTVLDTAGQSFLPQIFSEYLIFASPGTEFTDKPIVFGLWDL